MNSQYILSLNNNSVPVNAEQQEMYKKPMPLDMINKFEGLDSRILHQDDVVQKQAFYQSYQNFWSFVDFNLKYGEDNPIDTQTCTHQHEKVIKPQCSKTEGVPCTGITLTYAEARERANKL